jgi:phosphatidylinositol alpha-1,6-mannosyltransferase
VKVLLVNYDYAPLGGCPGRAMKHLVDELSVLHEVEVITTRGRGQAATEIQGEAKIHRAVVVGGRGGERATLRQMYGFLLGGLLPGVLILRKERCDIINSWGAVPSSALGVYLSRIFKIPHLLTLVGPDVYDPTRRASPDRSALRRFFLQAAVDGSRWCTAWSSDVRKRAKSLLTREVPIDVVPVGIPRPDFRAIERMGLGMDREAFYCATADRLIRRKRIDLLFEIFARSSDPHLRLLVIGGGPEKQNLGALVKALGLEQRVEMMGTLAEEKRFQYLSSCDAYVSVSAYEGLGLCYLEAMACGLPVLAPVLGGQEDILIHGKTGFALEPDGDDLLRRINELLDDPEAAIGMRKFNRAHVQPYLASNVADIWSETYQRNLKSMF